MTIKHALAIALVAPFLTVSSMAQTVDQHVYQGGPKTAIPHAARTIASPSEAFAMVPPAAASQAKRSHIYSGGPQTVVPHSGY